MKKINKFIISISIIISILVCNLFFINTVSKLEDNKISNIEVIEVGKVAFNIDDIITSGDDFVSGGENNTTIDSTELRNASDTIYTILLQIGMAAAVIIGLIIGIKYMVSSVEEKAEVKGAIIVYVVGCVLVFGGLGIWRLVATIFNSI